MDGKAESKRPMKQVSFCIQGVQFTIGCNLSAGDLMRIIEFCRSEQSNYRELLAQILHKKMRSEADVTLPSIEQILALSDKVFEGYIEGVIERNKEYDVLYSQLDYIQDPCERFARAIEKQAADNIAKAFKSFDWGPTIQMLNEQTRQLREVAEKVVIPTLQSIAEYTKKIVESSIGPLSATIQKLGKLANEMRTPSLTDSEKDALIESYQNGVIMDGQWHQK